MFTLKFYKSFEEGTSSEKVVCCQLYTVYTRSSNSYSVSIDGVDYNVSTKDGDYELCYIENSAGKTINKIRTPHLVGSL